MRLFQRLFSFWGKDLSNPEDGEQATGPATYSTSSGISVADEDALKISSVWACCQIITDSVSSLPLEWFRVREGERKPLEDTHPISQLWRTRPNKFMKWRDFRRAITFQLALWNNAYAKIEYDSNGNVRALIPIHPARVIVYRDETGLTYHYHSDKGVFVLSDRSVLHLKGMGAEGIVGLNRSDFARNVYGVAASADTYAAKQFANGGRPPGILKVDQFLTSEQRNKLADIYQGITATAENAGKLWVLEGGTSYEMLAHDPDTMQMIQSRAHSVGDVARFFGVPSVMIGGGDSQSSSWPASFENQQLAFLTFTLAAYLDEWECAMMDALVPSNQRGKVIVDHDEDDFVKMDSQAKASFLSTLTQNGLITRNEGRKKLGRSEVEGADELTVQVNLTPLQELESITEGDDDGNENEPA